MEAVKPTLKNLKKNQIASFSIQQPLNDKDPK